MAPDTGQRSFLLFSGTNDRAVFALLRAFRQTGSRCFVVARCSADRVLRSSYRNWVVAVRENDELDGPVLQAILDKVRLRCPDDRLVVVPISEYINRRFLALDREVLKSQYNCVLPLVSDTLYARVSDKASSVELMSAAGIRVPRAVDVLDASPPLVAKPIRNVGDGGLVRYPLLLRTPGDKAEFLSRDDVEQYFGQEFVEGESQYLLAYFSKSGDVFMSAQKNIAQQPGGKSILHAISSDFGESSLARRTVAILKAQGFHGLAMVEFIVDSEGACFIEINPRPWGPLQMCLEHRCGIVEAFIGDQLHDDSWRFQAQWLSKPRSARYLWLGGMLSTWAGGGRIHWAFSAPKRLFSLLRSLASDVYLRRDSWRVFLWEIFRK